MLQLLLISLLTDLGSTGTNLIAPVAIQDTYANLCGGLGSCCSCSKLQSCKANNVCGCQVQNSVQYYGNTCLLTQSQYTSVQLQTLSGADETQITSSFNIVQVYELLLINSTNTTMKQLTAIQNLALATAQSTKQASVVDWYLRIAQLLTQNVYAVLNAETSDKQTFQFQQFSLVQQLMYAQINLNANNTAFQYQMNDYSAYVALWKASSTPTTMKINGQSMQSASCNYTYRSVLVKYRFVMTVTPLFLSSFLNSSFIFNSSVTYCQFMDKYGTTYYPPSSQYQYQIGVPDYSYTTSIPITGKVIGLGCFQIINSNAAYSLYYNNQACQYYPNTSTSATPYCGCNTPGPTFVQALYLVGVYSPLMIAIYVIFIQ